ncbi:sure-like protein [Cryphonectria parasitica EP155]|uniref:Sure-like protein n=1 Tax=Cryphonectria parasitica (strain ATCC 38755 / EP155) TaxID=660469 RepID=A0A9P4XXU9_CRYP1|nr:sure-like protein [Cryphonectria parasitica EP155]KAF3763342.1 sure-like protein [Cryphonectria parasitica EP155]
MGLHSFLKTASVAALAVGGSEAAKIIQANDDGWAELYLRSFHYALIADGHDAVVSSPASDESAKSSLNLPPTDRILACEYDSCPAGTLTPTGTNASDTRLNWVNSYPATSMEYGINEFGPGIWGNGTVPDLAVSGPNVGSNLGFIQVEFSGTVGAACYAVDQGIPGIAFSGLTTGNLPWNTTPVPLRSTLYAELALSVTNTILEAGAPYLPDGVFLNVNMAEVEGNCTAASDFEYILTRINTPSALSTADIETCGDTWLPTETSVMDTGGCYVTISVGTCSDKTDGSATEQQTVLDKLGNLVTCLAS